MKLPDILSSKGSKGYALTEKHPHDDDGGSLSSEALLGENGIRSRRPKSLSKAYLILLPFVFGLGVVLGFTGLLFFKTTESDLRPLFKTPIPSEVFEKRLKVPFLPDSRYYGDGEAIDEGWKQITKGMPLTCYSTDIDMFSKYKKEES